MLYSIFEQVQSVVVLYNIQFYLHRKKIGRIFAAP